MNRQAATQAQVSGNAPGGTDDEPLIEIVDETEQRGQPQPGSQQQVQGDEDDAPVGNQPDSGVDDDGGGEQLAQGGNVQQMTPRQKRRQRERQRLSLERMELLRLREENQRLAHVVQRTDARIANVEQSGLDQQITGVETEINRADLVMQRALEGGNAADFMQAQRIRDVLRDRLNVLKATKAQGNSSQPQMAQGGPPAGGAQGAPTAPVVTPQQRHYGGVFMARHPWFKLGSPDPESQTVQMIDEQMMREGHNPSMPDYWIELERRINEELPHRAAPVADSHNPDNGGESQPTNNGRNSNGPTGGPPVPGSGNRGGSNGPASNRFHLSAARKQALIDLGVWDNPTERNKHIKAFMEWDRQHVKQ